MKRLVKRRSKWPTKAQRVKSSAPCEIGGLNCGIRYNTERKRKCLRCKRIACFGCGSLRGHWSYGVWQNSSVGFYCNRCQVDADRTYEGLYPGDCVVVARQVNLFLIGSGVGAVKMSDPMWRHNAITIAKETMPKEQVAILRAYLRKRDVMNRLMHRST